MYVQFCNEAKSCAYWLVNETLWYETETRPRRLVFSPRRDRDRDLPTIPRDRDETETFGNYVSRPSRDRDVETETTSLQQSVLFSLASLGTLTLSFLPLRISSRLRVFLQRQHMCQLHYLYCCLMPNLQHDCGPTHSA